MKINDSLYQVDDVLGNPTLIVAPDYLTVVDTGVPGSDGKIIALVESLGRKPSDIRQILITHSDGDHIGGLPALVAATGARVIAQAVEAEVIAGRRPARSGQLFANPVPVAQIVKEGDVLDLHGGIRVVETFGHTVGHISYYLIAHDLLVTGDCLVNSEGLSGSRPQYTYDAAQAAATVHKLARLGPGSLAFGHGAPIIGGAPALLKELAANL